MRVIFFSLLIFLIGCASERPVRKIASVDTIVKIGQVDLKKSSVQIFPAVAADDGLWYYFYVQLRDTDGKYIDADPSDIGLKTDKGKPVPFKLERLLVGRYYLTLEKTADISSVQMDFFIQGKKLKEQFKMQMRLPDKAHSKITIVKNTIERITFRLRLADKLNQPVEIPDRPEIILEGVGSVENIKHVHEGIWEFSLIYPNENQIMYFSVRAHGVYLNKLFRYQHVEK